MTNDEMDAALEKFDKTEPSMQRKIIAALVYRVKELQAFKDWVHRYLDDHGVPHHPPGVHGAEGCRIGDRLDWLMERVAKVGKQ